MFVLSLGLQSPSPVSSRYSLLEGAFRETGRDHMHHCLELSSEMTCYVLQAGMINSPHSFLKNGWIIPHDWRAIVATRERLFLCETKAMVGEEMCYKFSVAAVHATSWTCGEWHVEPRHALEMLDPYLNSGERFDCWLVSGLGTLAVQSLLKTSWAEIKTNMSPIELALARVWEECNPAVLVSPQTTSGVDSSRSNQPRVISPNSAFALE
ncbi:hypothetical protein BASA82_000229 [Batrachochytrium salamandrivorans]|nr:hypothetical protein BASA82_000229 [Batrachochytrium salamandrivorans]